MLRRLKKKDVPRMLEWMHDYEVNKFFRFNFAGMTKEKVIDFIEDSFTDVNQNFAFTDESDNYLGTISLKNISKCDRNAEYAIVTTKSAQGTGAAYKATMEILRYAFNDLHLERVYLNVLDDNRRANNFYEKCGFQYEGQFKKHLCIRGEFKNLNWYGMTREIWNSMANCID